MLTPVLGKILESAMATRLGRIGIAQSWFGPAHAGGTPHVGVTELLQATSHALRTNPRTAILVMDIKGAFNGAKVQPMKEAMHALGISHQVQEWTASFMTSRTVNPRRGETQGPTFQVQECLPQGPPASPVLFAMLISDVGRQFYEDKIFVDDLQLMQFGTARGPVNLVELEAGSCRLVKPLRDKGLDIDYGKTRLLISPKPENPVSISIEGHQVTNEESLLYLGTIFQAIIPHYHQFSRNI